MELSQQLLSDVVIYTKYAKFLEDKKRRSNWRELVTEVENMHIRKFPNLRDQIEDAFKYVYDKKIIPSMRSMQFAGKAIELSESRIYNCAYLPIEDRIAFREVMFLLMGGTGVGYSVQKKHIEKLPEIKNPTYEQRYIIGDSAEGWSDALNRLCKAYFEGKTRPRFIYSDIREKGTPLKKSGGKAPGPDRLRVALEAIEVIFKQAIGRKLYSIEVHDIICHIGNCIVAGGIRDSAMISLFSPDDLHMVTAKSFFNVQLIEIEELQAAHIYNEPSNKGYVQAKVRVVSTPNTNMNLYTGSSEATVWLGHEDLKSLYRDGRLAWYHFHPQRGKANNSAIALRKGMNKQQFMDFWKFVEESKAGEPGIYWSYNDDEGTNPCVSGDSKILTSGGYKTIKELWELSGRHEYAQHKTMADYGVMDIVNRTGVDVMATNIFRTGVNVDMYKVSFGDGSFLKATPRHRFEIKDGKEWKEVMLKDLKVGDIIPINHHEAFGNVDEPEYALLAGWVIGDGSISSTNDQKRAMLRFWNDDINDVMPIMRQAALTNYDRHNQSSNQNPKYAGYEMVTEGFDHEAEQFISNVIGRMLHEDNIIVGSKHNIPTRIWSGNKQTVSNFLRGLFSADGHVQSNEANATIAVGLSSIHKIFLQDVRLLLNQFGIRSSIHPSHPERDIFMNDGKGGKKMYHAQQGWRLIINGIELCKKFNTNIGFIQQYKTDSLLNWFMIHKGSNNSKPKFETAITNIEYIGKEDSFCLHEPANHQMCVNGYYTMQCVEIALKPYQFCNLTSINAMDIESQEEFNARARAAAFIGTLQASYIDFHYLRPIWIKTTQEEALLGVSITGIAYNKLINLNLKEASTTAVQENQRMAQLININSAARVACIKPEGSGSLAIGSLGAGVHAIHDKYFLRRVRYNANDNLHKYLKVMVPDLVELDKFNPEKGVLAIPVKASEGAILRHESVMDFLERVKKFSIEWIKPGHVRGQNSHNVSATINIKNDEWKTVGDWMWDNKEFYNGLSCLPFDDHTYVQAPLETITEERYNELVTKLVNINLDEITETEDFTELLESRACSGGACLI